MAFEEFLARALISLGVGALIGVEREYSKKQVMLGIRTLSLASLFGMIISYLGIPYLVHIGLFVILIWGIIPFFSGKKVSFGLTTLFSFLLSYLLGFLVGAGLIVESVAISIIITLLLFIRNETRIFVKKLAKDEIFEALEFAIILFILYPITPSSLDFFGIKLPLALLLQTLILISAISFVTFLLLLFFGERILPLAGLLGGMVNAFAYTVSFLKKGISDLSFFLTIAIGKILGALFLSQVLFGFIPSNLLIGLTVMTLFMLVFVVKNYISLNSSSKRIRLKQPFSIIEGAKIAILMFFVYIYSNLFMSNKLLIYIFSLIAGVFSTNAVIGAATMALSTHMLTVLDASVMIFLSLISGLFSLLVLTNSTKVFNDLLKIVLLSMVIGSLCFLWFM